MPELTMTLTSEKDIKFSEETGIEEKPVKA
jgi:hypothetical protein